MIKASTFSREQIIPVQLVSLIWLVIKICVSASLASHRPCLWFGLKAWSLQRSMEPSVWNLPCKGSCNGASPYSPEPFIYTKQWISRQKKRPIWNKTHARPFPFTEKVWHSNHPWKAGWVIPWTFQKTPVVPEPSALLSGNNNTCSDLPLNTKSCKFRLPYQVLLCNCSAAKTSTSTWPTKHQWWAEVIVLSAGGLHKELQQSQPIACYLFHCSSVGAHRLPRETWSSREELEFKR